MASSFDQLGRLILDCKFDNATSIEEAWWQYIVLNRLTTALFGNSLSLGVPTLWLEHGLGPACLLIPPDGSRFPRILDRSFMANLGMFSAIFCNKRRSHVKRMKVI
jgi:hypothetical protein